MSLTSKTFYHNHLVYHSISPQTINNTTVNGTAIEEPWTKGRRMAIIAVVGSLANALTVGVEGRLRSDGSTWQNIKAHNGSDDLEWDVAGTADNTVELAELDLGALDSSTYEAIRITATNGSASNNLVAIAIVISGLIVSPSGTATPELLLEQRYDGGTP